MDELPLVSRPEARGVDVFLEAEIANSLCFCTGSTDGSSVVPHGLH